MRFGIMTVQMNALVPPGIPSEGILGHVASFDHAELVRDLAAREFDPIELGGDLVLFMPHTFAAPTIEKLAAFREETGVTYTVHLPLWSVETSTPLAPVRQGAVQALVDNIEATRILEPEVYVLHATGALAAEFYRRPLPRPAKAFLLRLFQNCARESLEAVLAQTGIPSRRLAIETIEFPLDLTLELAEELDLSVCLDIGHVLVGFSGPVDLFDALERCLPRLVEIHLHDAPQQGPEGEAGYGKDHQALGQGDLDVAHLLDRLTEAGFSGPLIFELTVEEALASLEVIRSLRPDILS